MSKELAQKYHVPVNDLESSVRRTGVINALKVPMSSEKEENPWYNKEIANDCRTLETWIVKNYPVAVGEWRDFMQKTIETTPKERLVFEVVPPWEEPLWKSDQAFYDKMKEKLKFPWEG